jgi:outer membrane lipoprotein carrier protein
VEAAPKAESIRDLVARVQNFYDATTSFESEFKQEIFVRAANARSSASGKVTFAKRGKMDWSYDEPKGNRVVSDGNVIRVYDAESAQMFEEPVTAESLFSLVFPLLSGSGNLADLFELTLAKGIALPDATVFRGLPKRPTAGCASVLFYIDNATDQLRRVVIIDVEENRNRFDFVNARINVPVTASQFVLVPPPGTRVIASPYAAAPPPAQPVRP